MKSVRLHTVHGSEASISVTPVSKVALDNGITVREVPALLAAWFRMGAITPRKDGGFDVVRHVPAGDLEALQLLLEHPDASAPRWQPFDRGLLLGISGSR